MSTLLHLPGSFPYTYLTLVSALHLIILHRLAFIYHPQLSLHIFYLPDIMYPFSQHFSPISYPIKLSTNLVFRLSLLIHLSFVI